MESRTKGRYNDIKRMNQDVQGISAERDPKEHNVRGHSSKIHKYIAMVVTAVSFLLLTVFNGQNPSYVKLASRRPRAD